MTATVPTAEILAAARRAAPSPKRLALDYGLRDFDCFPMAPLLQQGNPELYRQCRDIQRSTRTWANAHLRDHVENWDRLAGEDHNFIPWPAIDAGLAHGFLSMMLPRALGGGGMGPVPMGIFSEEIAAADAGMFVVYGAHDLALALVMSTLDLGLIEFLAREISEGERNGRAVILALAHTEPGGGSDVEDGEDVKIATVGTRYTAVPGGFRVKGRKVFISNGSIARYFVMTAWADPKNPAAGARLFVIPGDAPGLIVGRLEHKMGQRLSTAAEIIADDIFVPDAMTRPIDNSSNIDTVLSVTRGPVGAMSTGIIRGVLERTLVYLQQKRCGDHWLYEEQWVQMALSEMLAALQTGRGLYMDAALAVEYRGIGRLMTMASVKLPRVARHHPLFRKLLSSPAVSLPAQRHYQQRVNKAELQQLVGHSSIAKFYVSDLAVRTAMQGMEILGADADDPQWGVEKCLRDAKLAQIFEGTNQINRLHVVRGFLERADFT